MGLIRWGFFGLRVASSRSVEKEASLSSQGCKVSQVEVDENPAPVKGLIRRGCLGLSSASPSMLVVEEVLSSQVCSPLSTNSLSFRADELGRILSQVFPCMTEGGAPIYSSISNSQVGYSWRVKEKVAKQLNKNKELLAEVVVETLMEGVEGYSKGVLNAMNSAPVVGLS
jgi:hypothetical protein